MKRVLTAVALALAYSALALWWLWPLPTVWRDHSAFAARDLALTAADWHLIVWTLAWGTHALLNQPTDPFHANAFFPSESSLAYSDHLFGYLPIFGPIYVASGNPVLAANLTVFLTYPLCALAAYALARRWLPVPAAAVVGALYAFCPLRYRSILHLHMLGTFCLPLAILFADRWLERARARDAVGLALAMALQCLASFYLAYAAVLAFAVYVPLALWQWRERLDRRRIGGLALSLAAALAPLVATSLPYLTLRESGLVPSYGNPADPRSLGLLPVFAIPNALRYLTELGAGGFAYALAALALLPPWRERRRPIALGLLLGAWGTLLAFGPVLPIFGREIPSPYRLLMLFVPGFDAVRLPVRFAVIAQLGAALLAGVGFARALAAIPGRLGGMAPLASVAAAAVVALALWRMPAFEPVPLGREITGARVPAAYRWLAAHGEGRALLELPGRSFAQAGERMYLSTFHWLPIVQGYSAYNPPTPDHLNGIAYHLPSEAALQKLVDFADVGWLLVHLDEMEPATRANWERPLPPGLEEAGRFDSDLLLHVTRPTADDRRARIRAGARESFGGAPLGPVASPCPGELRWLDATSDWKLAHDQRVIVEIVNRSATAWPGPAVRPKDSVQLAASLLRPDGSVSTSTEIYLPDDVPPGGSLRTMVPLGAQWRPGEYTLRIEGFQTSGGSLARCGVRPLEQRVTVR